MRVITAGPKKGNTRDIMNALARALPVAVAQIKKRNLPQPGGDIVKNATKIAKYTRRNFKYVRDGLSFQDIKLPSALEASKTGDCKSLSLYIAAHLTALGIDNGLRFAGYGTPDLTHVYNFYLDENKKLHTLDACLESLKESPNYTKIEDMQTRIIAGVPVLSESFEMNGPRQDRRRKRREERKEDRQERREAGGRGKKIPMAIPRNGFLALVRLNFRGLAERQNKLLAKNPSDLKNFWLKLGGDFDKLKKAIEAGKNKRPIFGKGKRMNGIGAEAPAPGGAAEGADALATIQKFLPIVEPILTAIKGLFKKNDIESDGTLEPGEGKPLGDFEATDPETREAAEATKTTPGTTSGPINFKINPFLIAGGLAAVYFLTRKKGRK